MNEKYLTIFNKYELRFPRYFGSKSGYSALYPDHLIIFNARIYLKSYYEKEKNGKIRDFFKGQDDEIWYGDINLNIDIYKLYKVHLEIEEAIVICSEIGNKIVEIGDDLERHWIGMVGNKGISLKDFKTGLKNK